MRHLAATAALLLIAVACGDTVETTTTTGAADASPPTTSTEITDAPATTASASPEPTGTTPATGAPQPPTKTIASGEDPPNDLRDGEGNPVTDAPAYLDMVNWSHTVQAGVQTIWIGLGAEIEAAGTAVVEAVLTNLGEGAPLGWTVTYEAIEGGGSSMRLRPHQEGPTPTVIVGGTTVQINLAEFDQGLPPGSTLDVSLCDEEMAYCDDLEYQAAQ